MRIDLRRRGFKALDETAYEWRDHFGLALYVANNPLDREAVARGVVTDVFPGACPPAFVVTLEDLTLSKVREFDQHRDPKQIGDVRALLAVRRDDLDLVYLTDRLKRYNLRATWSETVEPGR